MFLGTPPSVRTLPSLGDGSLPHEVSRRETATRGWSGTRLSRGWSVSPRARATLSEDLSPGYGLRFSAAIYGSKREKTGENEYLQEYGFVLIEVCENLRQFTG